MNLKINSFEDLKKEGKSFYWASFFLPKKSRINAGTLYSVCRYFDDIADKDNNDQSEFLKSSINIYIYMLSIYTYLHILWLLLYS